MTRTLIFLESNIGAGKSSSLDAIRTFEPDWYIHDEPLGNWRSANGVNLLNLFYTDPPKYAFEFQTYVLEDFEKRLTGIKDDGVHIMARSPRSAIGVFSAVALSLAYITPGQHSKLVDIYMRIYRQINLQSAHFVYLRVTPETAFNRTIMRDRYEEHGQITGEYLRQLHKFHDEEFLNDADIVLDNTVFTPTHKESAETLLSAFRDIVLKSNK